MAIDTTYRDRRGFPITAANDAAAEKYQQGLDLYMSGNAGSEAAFRNAIEADPDFALAPAALAWLLLDTGRGDEARENADRARELAAAGDRRERQHAEVVATLTHGEGPRAYALMQEHLAEFPRDVLILVRADRYVFHSGGPNRQQLQLEQLERFKGDYADDWWFPGQYGFALGERGRYDEAVDNAKRSLALNGRNFPAAHALAHVYADTKDDEKGAAFLGPWLEDFDSRAPMFGHLSWHLTLFELGLGRHRRAMEIYRGGVSPAVCKHRSTLNNSASLLWRCMVYGYGASAEQWAEVQPLARRVAGRAQGEWDGMNAALAFAGAGNEEGKDRLVAALGELAADGQLTAREIGIPLVEGAWAYAQGDFDEAIRLIEPAIPRIASVGGSNAQHEVFWEALIDAYLRRDRFTEAETLQRRRMNPRPTARDEFRLGRALIGCGRPAEAADSLRSAAARWRDADPGSPEAALASELLKGVQAVS